MYTNREAWLHVFLPPLLSLAVQHCQYKLSTEIMVIITGSVLLSYSIHMSFYCRSHPKIEWERHFKRLKLLYLSNSPWPKLFSRLVRMRQSHSLSFQTPSSNLLCGATTWSQWTLHIISWQTFPQATATISTPALIHVLKNHCSHQGNTYCPTLSMYYQKILHPLSRERTAAKKSHGQNSPFLVHSALHGGQKITTHTIVAQLWLSLPDGGMRNAPLILPHMLPYQKGDVLLMDQLKISLQNALHSFGWPHRLAILYEKGPET